MPTDAARFRMRTRKPRRGRMYIVVGRIRGSANTRQAGTVRAAYEESRTESRCQNMIIISESFDPSVPSAFRPCWPWGLGEGYRLAQRTHDARGSCARYRYVC